MLDPTFRSWNIEEFLPYITVLALVNPGEANKYATLRQVKAIERGCGRRVRSVILSGCGHSPHRDRPQRTLEEITSFIHRELTHHT